MAALRRRYRVTMERTLDVLRGYAAQLSIAPTSPDLLDALRREVHRIHGTAGSYGHENASGLAAAVEDRLIQWLADPAFEREIRGTTIDRFILELSAAITHNGPADMPPAR
jgi:HPt (histidine-containing phosphotransfer) domain-containing protein